MTAPTPAAFWSYAHQDDTQDGGRILRLATRIQEEYSLITGTDLQMYVDRSDNRWGVVWRERIDAALQETTFFMPVLTPRYFTRQECRSEMVKFATASSSLGVRELLLPIRYIPIRNFTESNPDEAVALAARMQYVDWYELRLADEQSERYRIAVNALAERLAELSESIASRPAEPAGASAVPGPAAEPGDPYEDPDAPGLADVLADFEPAMERLTSAVSKVPRVMEDFSRLIDEASAELDAVNAANKPFAARVVVFRKLADALDGPSREMERVGSEYTAELLSADPAVRGYLEVAHVLARDDSDSESQRIGNEALNSIRETVEASRENLESFEGLAAAVRSNVRLSRDLRPALLRIEAGVRSLIDAQAILEEWGRLVETPPSSS